MCRPCVGRDLRDITSSSFYFGMLGPDDGELRPSNFLHLAHQLSLYLTQATGFQARQARRARWRRHTLRMNGCTDSMRVLRLHVADTHPQVFVPRLPITLPEQNDSIDVAPLRTSTCTRHRLRPDGERHRCAAVLVDCVGWVVLRGHLQWGLHHRWHRIVQQSPRIVWHQRGLHDASGSGHDYHRHRV